MNKTLHTVTTLLIVACMAVAALVDSFPLRVGFLVAGVVIGAVELFILHRKKAE